jgi:hypothetical protein
MPDTTVITPVSTPSVDRLTLGVTTAREAAHPSGWPMTWECSASTED